MKRLFEFCCGLTATIIGGVFLAASLILMLTNIQSPIDPAWITAIFCGFPLIYVAITRLVSAKGMMKISSSLLISTAMIASIIIGDVFAAGEIAFIMAIGEILEDKTAERAKKGIKQLIGIVPRQGRKIIDGREQMVPVEQIRQNDTLRVLPGEAIPVDGEILSGNTSVDQSVMTGESLPVDKTVGDSVFCGTINRFGSIDIRGTNVGEDSSLQTLIRMVREAEKKKAPMQRIVDKWASWLVPIALVIAIITYIATRDITRAVTVLVVFCPCALALATPTSIMAAIGQGTKHGVIIKSGEALERMGKADCIAFDKTGTLTHGKLTVCDIVTLDPDLPEGELLSLAASAESYSEHPLGKAVTGHAKEHAIPLKTVTDFIMIPGRGISANVGGEKILCGSSNYLRENGIRLSESDLSVQETFREQGKAVILVSSGTRCVGIVALSDTLRSTAKGMLEELRINGAEAVLLTGDHAQTANYFAEQVGITSVYSELLPAQKAEKIEELQRQGYVVCMIGDGVNDAPALKVADIGTAMGGMGSDIAVEAADVVLMGDDISKVPYLKRLSRATIRLIKFNITLAMFINFAAIILSILALLNTTTGALVHNAGAVLVVLNAALLYDRKFI